MSAQSIALSISLATWSMGANAQTDVGSLKMNARQARVIDNLF